MSIETNQTHYIIDDERFTRVTTICNLHAKPWLKPWYIKQTAEFCVNTASTLDTIAALEGREAAVEFASEGGEAACNRARNLGSEVHEIIEKRIKGLDVPLTPATEPYIAAWEGFCEKHRPTFLASEMLMVNEHFKYAGRADALVRIDGYKYLVDWKTGAWDKAHAMQQTAYRRADIMQTDRGWVPMQKVRGCLLVKLTNKGNFSVRKAFTSNQTWSHFLKNLQAYELERKCRETSVGEILGEIWQE